MNATATLQSAQDTLVQSINATKVVLDMIATEDVGAALERLQEAADGALARIAAARARLSAITATVVNRLNAVAVTNIEDLGVADGEEDVAYLLAPATAAEVGEQQLPAPVAQTAPATPALALFTPSVDDEMVDLTAPTAPSVIHYGKTEGGDTQAITQDGPPITPAVSTAHRAAPNEIGGPGEASAIGEPIATATVANSPIADPERDNRRPLPTMPTTKPRRRKRKPAAS